LHISLSPRLTEFDRARKSEWGLVKIAHRRSAVEADIEGFVCGKTSVDGLVHAAPANFLVVDEQRDRAAVVQSTAVVLEPIFSDT
jgi:hypothetical protein